MAVLSKDFKQKLKTSQANVNYFDLKQLNQLGLGSTENLPFSIKLLLENALRNCDGKIVTEETVQKIAKWSPKQNVNAEIFFYPGRVLLQDFTGVPCVVDLAAMRTVLSRLGGDYCKINPQVPCDLIIDHSLQVDAYGSGNAQTINTKKEFERNKERYEFLKWGQHAFKNFFLVPPGQGIIHQINLEYLAKGLLSKKVDGKVIVYPDTLVGTDSHTTMINGLGVMGWGVGGIEAEAVMLGEPIGMLLPRVIGVNLVGKLTDNVTATDLVLTLTQILRKKNVVGCFVEYFGEGLKNLSLPDRATISNMAPEYGATMGLMPIDACTLDYYRMTGRKTKEVDLLEAYLKEQGMFYTGENETFYSEQIEVDLSTIHPCLAGPRKPQERISLEHMKTKFHELLKKDSKDGGYSIPDSKLKKECAMNNQQQIGNGSIVIASITSCTNTSNPYLLIAAGLLAKQAVAKGLKVPGHVKTSFAPGSRVVEEYLKSARLVEDLNNLGFQIVGYGCATCIGNSGPLDKQIEECIKNENLITASVLSGNRNFEGRIHPMVKANFLASPPMVIAYALAGTVNIDFINEPIGAGGSGEAIYLKDIWPSNSEITAIMEQHVKSETFKKCYGSGDWKNDLWDQIKSNKSELYEWDKKNTYIQEPPFFENFEVQPRSITNIEQAQILLMLGDTITTDHISPAGRIEPDSAAGKYLKSLGLATEQFNTYGSRRGNDLVMSRGTFANVRLRNQLVDREGPWTKHFPTQEVCSVFEASQRYRKEKIPLVVIAGKEYGSGSSRDWAAKGPHLLGVRVVLASSFERIHRSNLIGMGILPLQFKEGMEAKTLGLNGEEILSFSGLTDDMAPGADIIVTATHPDGKEIEFLAISRLDTPVEMEYYRNGGILQTVLRKMLNQK